MTGPIKQFIATRNEEAFVIGKLERDTYPGAYLTPEYLHYLREVLTATRARLNRIGDADLPGAMENLLCVLDHLLDTHRQQMISDVEQECDGADYAKARENLKKAIEALTGGCTGPKRA